MTSLDKMRELDAVLEKERTFVVGLANKLARTYKIEKADAEQEAFLAAWKALQTFDGRASVKTFLQRSIINHFLNLKRKKSVETEDCVQLDLYEEADDIAEASEFASVRGPQEILEDLQVAEFFYRQLELFEEELRTIIELRIHGDASFAEIAKQLQVPVVSVRVKLHRALKEMRRDFLGKS